VLIRVAGIVFTFVVASLALAQQPEAFKDPDEANCVVSPFTPLVAAKGSFVRDPKDRSSTQVLQVEGHVEVKIEQAGCAHYSIGVTMRWVKKPPTKAMAIKEAVTILKSLKQPDGNGGMLSHFGDLLRKMSVSQLGKELPAGEYASMIVSIESGVLTIGYSFAA